MEEDAKELNTDPQEKPVSKSSGCNELGQISERKNKKSGLETNMS